MKFCIDYDLTPQTPYTYTKNTLRKEDHIGQAGKVGLWIQQLWKEMNMPKEKGY